jgi:UDPglucose 6-dehydrogenase
MKIGFIGLGKLGMPVAVCMSMKGHDVLGFDIDTKRMSKSNYPFEEVGTKNGETFQDMLNNSNIKFTEDLQQLIDHAELIFVAIQTPHSYEFEGVTRFKNTQDFDYTYLIKCLQSLCDIVKTNKVVSIISTVAPGTYASSLTNVLKTNTYVNYCYNPFFIAMGTVVPDFLNPEFVLIGTENPTAGEVLKEFYSTIHNKPVRVMSTASAEITKMAYNTMIGLKICFANNAMELCNIFCGNVDDVTDALKGATDRLISTKYLTAGMGDGGGCHPRDNIVLSYLAAKHNMSCDIAGACLS